MHVTDTDPKLVEYAKERMQWQGAYIASLDLSKIDGVNPDSIRRGLARVNMEWHLMVIRPQRLRRLQCQPTCLLSKLTAPGLR